MSFHFIENISIKSDYALEQFETLICWSIGRAKSGSVLSIRLVTGEMKEDSSDGLPVYHMAMKIPPIRDKAISHSYLSAELRWVNMSGIKTSLQVTADMLLKLIHVSCGNLQPNLNILLQIQQCCVLL